MRRLRLGRPGRKPVPQRKSRTTVFRRLHRLPETTGADELAITTVTQAHADRVRYELLADAWLA